MSRSGKTNTVTDPDWRRLRRDNKMQRVTQIGFCTNKSYKRHYGDYWQHLNMNGILDNSIVKVSYPEFDKYTVVSKSS